MLHSKGKKTQDGTIDLRADSVDEEPEFKIGRIDDEDEEVSSAPVSEGDIAAMKPYDKVKVKFDKFVNLVATHASEELFNKHAHEDVILSTDLLTDLANAHEEKSDKKVPMMFIFGIILGIGITWLLLKS